jgi:hypothetical protein
MELDTGEYRRLDVNSDFSESWHSWSSNSRWIAFSSKRRNGLFTRCYFSYVDPTGRVHKPFVLPQRDPDFYDSSLKTVSVPELITGPVPVSDPVLSAAVRGEADITPDALSGATPPAATTESWLPTME